MRVLVTNDDGIHAPGLWKLAESLNDVGEVFVVAPDRDLSGIGTAKTLLDVVRVHDFASPIDGVKAMSVEGTPSDCVILSTETLFDEPFDLIVSGINAGANLGIEVLMSGTVGAAIQGFLSGISSVAISAAYTDPVPVRYDSAAWVAGSVASAVGDDSDNGPVLLNVNLPDAGVDGIRGVEVTRLSRRAFTESVVREDSGRRTHYWIRHNRPVEDEPEEGTDVWALRRGRISITSLDMPFMQAGPSPLLAVVAEELNARLGLPGD